MPQMNNNDPHAGHNHRRLSTGSKRQLQHDDHAGHAEAAFPLVFFFFVLGFFIMLFLDQVIFKSTTHGHSHGNEDEQ